MKAPHGFDRGQVRLFVKAVRKETGDAWGWMVPRLREALIAEKAFHVFACQERPEIRTDALFALLRDMRAEAGIEPKANVALARGEG